MNKRYQPASKDNWKGRDDSPQDLRFHQIIKMGNLDALPPPQHIRQIALLGFACDEGIKRNQGNPGAKSGPQAIRQALAGLPFCPHALCNVFDFGDITCDDDHLEEAQQALAETVAALLQNGLFPIVLGGGHEVAWGHFQGIHRAKPDLDCSIVNFDAHYDLRPLVDGHQGNSGTSFLQIANLLQAKNRPFDYTCVGIQRAGNTPSLFSTADRLGVHTITAEEIVQQKPSLNQLIDSAQGIYLTICMDVFSSAYAPGVSARQPLGLTPWQVIPLLKQLAQSQKVISMDIAEVSPPRDRDGMTAQLAALLIHAFLSQ